MFFVPLLRIVCFTRRPPRSRQTARLAALYAQTQIKVDWANDEHHALLRKLWQLMAPPDLGANFPGTKSEQWKLLGFQVSVCARGGSICLSCHFLVGLIDRSLGSLLFAQMPSSLSLYLSLSLSLPKITIIFLTFTPLPLPFLYRLALCSVLRRAPTRRLTFAAWASSPCAASSTLRNTTWRCAKNWSPHR